MCLHRRLPWPQRRQRSAFAGSSRSVVTAAPRKNTSAADRLSPVFRRCAAQRALQCGSGLQRPPASRPLISLGTATISDRARRALASGRCASVRSAMTVATALAMASGRSVSPLSRGRRGGAGLQQRRDDAQTEHHEGDRTDQGQQPQSQGTAAIDGPVPVVAGGLRGRSRPMADPGRRPRRRPSRVVRRNVHAAAAARVPFSLPQARHSGWSHGLLLAARRPGSGATALQARRPPAAAGASGVALRSQAATGSSRLTRAAWLQAPFRNVPRRLAGAATGAVMRCCRFGPSLRQRPQAEERCCS